MAKRGEMNPGEIESEEAGRDGMEIDELDRLAEVFRQQLTACLEECAQGRRGLFMDLEEDAAGQEGWPAAARLRELALALQGVFAQAERRCALCDEFLDLCSIHGESNPGERRLARALLERMEKGEVGTPTEEERKPWS